MIEIVKRYTTAAAILLLPAMLAAEEPLVHSLTIRECVDLAVARNLKIRSEHLNYQVAEQNIRGERGVFEPEFVASVEGEQNTRQNTVEQSLNQLSPFFIETNTLYNASVEGLLPLGTQYRIGYSLSDLSNNLTNQFFQTPFANEYNSFAGISITQPLLKNAGYVATMTRIRLAQAGSEIAQQELRQQLMATVSATEATYWDLVLAQEELKTLEESVRMAEKILEDNRERVKAGKMSELEVFQAEAGVATRRARLQLAHQRWVDANNRMLTILAESAGDRDVRIEASSKPDDALPEMDFVESVRRSLELNPGYFRQLKQVEQEDLRLVYAKNQRWPQLDLVGSYGFNGLGWDEGDSFDRVTSGDYDAWSLGVTLRIPLGGNLRGASDLEMARLRKEKALVELKSVEVEVANAVRAAMSKVTDTHQSIADQRLVAEFNQRLLDVELERLAAGKSDSRRVLEIEEDLSKARIAELRSLIAFKKAMLELELAEGSVLINRGLEDRPAETGADLLASVTASPTADELVPMGEVVPAGVHPAAPAPAEGAAPRGGTAVPRGRTGSDGSPGDRISSSEAVPRPPVDESREPREGKKTVIAPTDRPVPR